MEKVHTLRSLSGEIGVNYHTIRRWCHTNVIEFSRTPTGTICLTDTQVEKLLKRMVQNGNAHVHNDAGAASEVK